MVSECVEFNYVNTTNSCNDFQRCATRVHCPFEDGHHCFGVYNESNANNPIGLGCNKNYKDSPDENCGTTCIGQPKGTKYYCCCIGHLCNLNITFPTTKKDLLIPRNREIDSRIQPERSIATLWSVIPIVFLVLTFGMVYAYWSKRINNRSKAHNLELSVNNKNNNEIRRNKGVSGNLNDSELRQLRNDHYVPILMPFNNHFSDEAFHNNGTHINNNNNLHTGSSTNHIHSHNHLHQHDANNHNSRQQQQNDYRIDLNSVKLLEIIGSGRFGTVHRATLNTETGSEFAVKIITSSEHQSWLNELQIYKCPRVKHPNILKLLYSDEHLETECYWLVVEYASKGSLYTFLTENTVNWKEFLHIALGIVRGLSHLHEADIAHRDFKSKNVLLKHDLTPCITDFGVATILDSSTGSQLDHKKKYLQVGTPRYMAPEVLECSVTFTKASFTKIDVYALSLVLWELISRCHPLPKLTTQNSTFKQQQQPFPSNASQAHISSSQNQEENEGQEASDAIINRNHNIVSNPSETGGNNLELSDEQPPPYRLPFEDIAGPHPDIIRMRQIVVVDKLRPALRDDWRLYPASELCRAIEDGWEYDHDARISASCFVERVESLPQSI